MIETKFKHTEIGLIPEEWKVGLLGDYTENYTGLTYSPSDVCEYGTLVLRSSNIQNDILSFSNNVFVKMNIPQRAMAQKGDILVCVRNGSKSLIGKSAKVTVDGMAFGAFMTVLRTKKLHKEFLLFLWRAGYIQQQIHTLLGATINQITNADIKCFNVAIPTPKEQQRIATALSDIDALISAFNKKIEKKKLIKQGAMQQLLTGQKRLQGFSEPWIEVKIDDLFNIGNGYTPSKEVSSYWENGTIPWFRMEDIRTNGRILKDSIQHITKLAVKNSGLFPAYSIILSTTATIGEHALLIADSLANQRFNFLTRKLNRCGDIDVMYFFHYCFILGEWCRANINEGGLAAVNMTDLKNYTFTIPPTIAEQTVIAEILSDMDKEIAELESKRTKYDRIKQGMMQQLLTGKIRLTD